MTSFRPPSDCAFGQIRKRRKEQPNRERPRPNTSTSHHHHHHHHHHCWSLLFLVYFPSILPTTIRGYGIPGTASTLYGYDTEGGEDPVCWISQSIHANQSASNSVITSSSSSSSDNTNVRTKWDNELVANYELLGEVTLLKSCPNGTWIEGTVPPSQEHALNGVEMLRTGREYQYTIRGSIDMEHLNGDTVVSDRGPLVAVQIVLCELGRVGFCSPFVHEQANDRLKANNVTEDLKRGDRHGGTHVHSGYQSLAVDATARGVQAFEVVVPVRVNTPGVFFVIAAMQAFTADSASAPRKSLFQSDGVSEFEAQYKYNVANALEPRLVSYKEPPEILEVSRNVKIVSFVLIGLASATIGFLIVETVRHRKHQVIQLSQGNFLIILLFAALVATTCSFLFIPKNDLYCKLHGPIVLISLQLMYAVMIGRLWRINAVISPLLMMSLKKRDSISTRFFRFVSWVVSRDFCPSCAALESRHQQSSSRRRHASIRKTVTCYQLARVVAIFTLPQIIVQICSLVIFPSRLEIEFNDEMSIGRTVCEGDDDRRFIGAGIYVLLGLHVIMLILARQSQSLPSLFSETHGIYSATLLSVIILAIGLVVIALTDDPTTSPEVSYILFVIFNLCMTLNTSLRVMLPKLQMVWRNETVVVSKLVTDHRIKHEKRHGKPVESFQTQSPSRRWVLGIAPVEKGDTVHTSEDVSNESGKRLVRFAASSSGNSSSSIVANTDSRVSSGADSEALGTLEAEEENESSSENELKLVDTSVSDNATPPALCSAAPGAYVNSSGRFPTTRSILMKGRSKKLAALHQNPNTSHRVTFSDNSAGEEMVRIDGGSIGRPSSVKDQVNEVDVNDQWVADFEDQNDFVEGNKHAGPLKEQVNNDDASTLRERVAFDPEEEESSAVGEWRSRSTTRSDLAGGGAIHAGVPHLSSTLTAMRSWKESRRPRRHHQDGDVDERGHVIRISDADAPARRLVLRMVELQELLIRANQRIMTGLLVSHEDWKLLREASVELGCVFGEEVEFEWENGDAHEEN